jgi:hypothetical protein
MRKIQVHKYNILNFFKNLHVIFLVSLENYDNLMIRLNMIYLNCWIMKYNIEKSLDLKVNI